MKGHPTLGAFSGVMVSELDYLTIINAFESPGVSHGSDLVSQLSKVKQKTKDKLPYRDISAKIVKMKMGLWRILLLWMSRL